MKAFRFIMIAAILTAALAFAGGCAMTTSYLYQDSDKYTPGDRDISETIDTIDIDYLSGEIKLMGYSGSSVSVRETANMQIGDEKKVHTWVNGSTLYVRYCTSAKKLDLYKLEKTLEISIPEGGDYKDIRIHVSSGDAVCENFNTELLSIESSSGDIRADICATNISLDASSGKIGLTQHLTSDNIRVHTSSGDISVSLDNADMVDLEASSGNIRLSGDYVRKLDSHASSGNSEFDLAKAPDLSDVHSSSGDITFRLPEDTDLTAEVEISSGDFFSELPISKDGDRYIAGSGFNKMKLHASSGDISFLKK